jgi:hypothetical protein
MKITVKESYKNKVVERKNSLTNNTIRVDFTKLDESKYLSAYHSGFADCFDVETDTPKVKVTKIHVEVDNLADLTYNELKEQARAKGLQFEGNIKKKDLIALLNGKA